MFDLSWIAKVSGQERASWRANPVGLASYGELSRVELTGANVPSAISRTLT